MASKLRKVILDQGERILMKSPNNGCPELRDAICRYLARNRNINVTTEQIVIGSGAEYLYGLCIQMLGRDRIVALGNPSYRKIREVYTANGASCELLSMDSEGIRTDELKRSKAGILHVTPFNSFPSHITASAERRQEYLNWAKERKAVIIEDDYDSEFSLKGTAPVRELFLSYHYIAFSSCESCLQMRISCDFIQFQCHTSCFCLFIAICIFLCGII